MDLATFSPAGFWTLRTVLRTAERLDLVVGYSRIALNADSCAAIALSGRLKLIEGLDFDQRRSG
jgi:hypothetical protein